MGNLFSVFPQSSPGINESFNPDKKTFNSDDVAHIVSSINFSESEDEIADPERGDPCALYIEGLNSSWSTESFKKFLKKSQILFIRARKDQGVSYGTIYFDNNDDRRNAYKILTTVRFENTILYVVPLTKNFTATQSQCNKLQNKNKSKKSIVDRVTPWLAIEYPEQIRQKVFKYSKILEKVVPHGSQLTDVIPMDKTTFYFNDVELTIGWNKHRRIVVGFNLGSAKDDTIAEINKCVNIPPCAIKLADQIRKFIVVSGAPPFNRIKKVGIWKFARIRQNLSGQIMLIIGTFGNLSEEMQEKLKKEFTNVHSLYYAETSDKESFGHKYNLHHLSGVQNIADTICGCVYPIYPVSVFPNSISSFEKIIHQVSIFGSFDRQTLVIDVDAGYGLYSFSISNIVSKVVAFESNDSLIQSFNSIKQNNSIKNVEIKEGYFEDKIAEIKPSRNQKVVAIVHPPHCGIRRKALFGLQRLSFLKAIIFVSTNAEQLVKDCDEVFLNPQNETTAHFNIDSYIVIDSAPHTERATVVLSLVR
ncbi:hypothetical protein TRFO_01116 [Tritrichomonas foetus]|uniref:RRM domain-containing protein n=1 Tax=Tritrichomonas foetus TaxID=1144522 RepID=A0A1J4KP40_9EUKA|nr:hypothetical protein TRFO_01116 [Tritrichomonas foetus]|eukprot:OHT11189.1 hypothetical protein TRFO_01116 [Tritrichomonas foetus]